MCDYRTWLYRRHHSNTTTTLHTMLKCYLWLTLCLQFALINAARTRRGNSGVAGGDASEHVHIKVHVPDMTRLLVHRHRFKQNYQLQPVIPPRGNVGKKTFPTQPADSNGEEMPYEFDFYGMGDGDNSLMTTDMMDGGKFGPVLFGSDVKETTLHNPISQQFIHQLFIPDVISTFKAENIENDLNNSNGFLEDSATFDVNDWMQEYFQKLNQPQKSKTQTYTPKLSSKESKKQKYFGNFGISEGDYPKQSLQQQFYNTIQKENQNLQQPTKAKRNKQQQRNQQRQQPIHQNFNAFQQAFEYDSSDESDELEADENISATTVTSASNEDMTTAFNGLHPISFTDMYGEYDTPITAASTTVASSSYHDQNHHQHQGYQGYHEKIPTYASTFSKPYNANNWLHFQQQEQKQQPELHKFYYKPQHQQQQLKQHQKKHKPKAQQTQYVLSPTSLHLTPSSSSSSSSSPSSSSYLPSLMSPISSGFGSSSSTWNIPYDFVQQSHQQQLDAQQRPQQKQKLTSYKKRKNRTKRKRNRIIVE